MEGARTRIVFREKVGYSTVCWGGVSRRPERKLWIDRHYRDRNSRFAAPGTVLAEICGGCARNMVRKASPPHTSTSRASGGVPFVYTCRAESRDQAPGAGISLYGPQTL
jgi:hypothetical protein